MPFTFGEITTPGGRRCLLVEVSGPVSLADAQAMERHLLPGSAHHGGLVLSRVAKGTEYSPEARKFFPSLQSKYRALGTVVTSSIVRAAINLMIRLTPQTGGEVRMFTTEAEALAWLDGVT